MPLYQYECSCGHSFTQIQKMDDRDAPLQSPCPQCSTSGGVTRPVSLAAISFSGFSLSKVPDAFKDKLREIKRENPRSNIDV